MNRRTTLLSTALAVVAAIGGYKYYEILQERRAEQVHREAAYALYRLLEERRKAQEVSPEEQETLVNQAREWLDQAGLPGVDLSRAHGNLQHVLKSNPINVPARIEMARYLVITGHMNYRNFQPGVLEQAFDELSGALSADPKSADAHVLLGHVQYLALMPWQAVTTLQKAEKLGGETNPWLYLNWADALMDLHQLQAAEAKLGQAQALFAAKPPPKRVQAALHSKLSDLYTKLHRIDDADREYQAEIALQPESGSVRCNYATFLLLERGLPDAAIEEAGRALELGCGFARLVQAGARYAKWAELKSKAPQQAAEFLVAAKADTPDFSWIMPQAASSIGTGPAIENMVKGLVTLGVPLDTKDEHGDTGLTLAADSGKLRSVQLLAKYRANLEARDNEGQTALIIAARQGHLDIVKTLAARGARINVQDSAGRSALHWAARGSDDTMLRTLIALKINVNMASTSGYTALMQTAFAGNAHMAELLLAAGADPRAATIPEKRSAADLAEAKGHQELAGKLRRAASQAR